MLDLLNSELLESQFYHNLDINELYKNNNSVLISGFTYSTGVVQPLSEIKETII